MAEETLFDEAVARSGLNPVIAPFTVSRLLLRAEVQPKTLTREGLAQALPAFEEGLAVYLRDDELEAALAALRELAAENDR
jgi:hypothetical protein